MLWNIIEKEKSILAQELHDTILQERLHLARELDVLAAPTIQKETVLAIREQIIECNEGLTRILRELKSPLLDTFGLQMALKNSFKR